jgi:DNA primase
MAKISQVSAKYIVHAKIEIEGIVDRPDVIGAIFGQTEGLLGAELELRELQRSGRIGRIEVEMQTRAGKTNGTIVIPSSLDKAETSIIAASLEIIQRIGPCNAKIRVENIEDIRITKREFVLNRAKELLKNMMSISSPDSQELSEEVQNSVRVMEIVEYGADKLAAGPTIDESDEIVIVEGRADVVNLLKHGFKNVIATNGTTVVSQTIIELSKRKTCTIFTDGDRGGDLIIKAILNAAEIDFVTKAPDGKEVEELAKKEIHKCLRSRIAAEQIKLEITTTPASDRIQEAAFSKVSKMQAAAAAQQSAATQTQLQERRPMPPQQQQYQQRPMQSSSRPPYPSQERRPAPSVREPVNAQDKVVFKKMIEDLVGTNGACILNDKKEILGKVPISELELTLKNLGQGIYAVILDGVIEPTLVAIAEKADIQVIVGMEMKSKPASSRVALLTVDDI